MKIFGDKARAAKAKEQAEKARAQKEEEAAAK
jgi:hypothetical protein